MAHPALTPDDELPIPEAGTAEQSVAERTQPVLRLVRSDRAELRTVLLCTLDTALAEEVSAVAGAVLQAVSSEAEMCAELVRGAVQRVLVDGTPAGLNPHRLVRIVRSHNAAPEVWLAVARRDDASALLAQGLGVERVTRRVRAMLAVIDPDAARQGHIDGLVPLLDAIDQVFAAQAGPTARLFAAGVRRALLEGQVQSTAEAYAQTLLARLRLPGPREQFVLQVRALLAQRSRRHHLAEPG